MSSSLPEGWRPLRPEDAAAVAELIAEDERFFGLRGGIGERDVLDWWRRGDGEQNWCVLEEDGRFVAAGWFETYGGDLHGGGVVHPTAKGRGLGPLLVDRAEARARELGGGLLRLSTLGPDEAARRLFESRGYREVRRHYDMAVELSEEPPEPEVPAGLAIGTFREEDAQAMHDATVESFADEWGFHALPFEEWWQMRKADDHSLWFLVRDGAEIAAYARCDEGLRGGGFVGMLGVRPPWRRRGLGRALLLHAFREFRRRGAERVSLGVNAENPTGATRLYESVGMHVDAEFVTFEKEVA